MKKKVKLAVKKELKVLPTTKRSISAADSFTLFLYGPEGIGKTTFASQANDPLIIATEAGFKFVEAYVEETSTWEDFVAVIDAIESAWRDDPSYFLYGALAVDTVDNAFALCQTFVCTKLGIDHPSDEEWGKGYQAVSNEFTHQMTRLALIDRQLILISHEKTMEVKGRVLKTMKIVPTLSSTGRRVILPMVDIIGHCGYRMGSDGEATSERVIEFNPSETMEAKDRTGLLPKILPLNYGEFHEYLSGTKIRVRKGTTSKSLPKMKRHGR
mgnify:CR=1 FL=1